LSVGAAFVAAFFNLESLFGTFAIFISFSLVCAAAAAAVAADFCCCCSARPHPTPPPPFMQSLAVRLGCTRFTCASTFCALLASSSSFFPLSESLSPSSQVSRGALGLLRYDGSGRVRRGKPDVLVSSSVSPWRHEL
jgi:hypothetical protein